MAGADMVRPVPPSRRPALQPSRHMCPAASSMPSRSGWAFPQALRLCACQTIRSHLHVTAKPLPVLWHSCAPLVSHPACFARPC